MESIYATKQEIQEHLLQVDLHKIIFKLERYAHNRINGMNLSVKAIDVVSDILLSIQEDYEGRLWNKTKYPKFERFLFEAVRSHISNSYDKHKNRQEAETGHLYSYQPASYQMEVLDEIDLQSAKKEALACVAELGGDAEEECILECWFDGITKPQEIAEFLGVPVEVIYNATKRLNRKVPQIQKRLNCYHL